MDLQPSRNVGLENQLQAIQLGASLYDRAQTQKRMMEQLQVQTADQLMRQRQADLQNKIQSNAYAQALSEQEAQSAEYDTFQKFNEEVGTYFNDPELKSPMPALPRFRSKVFNQQATQAYQGLQQYSPRAKIIKSREQFDKLRANSIEEMTNQGIDVFDPQTGQINEEVYRTNLPVIREQMKERQTIKDLGTEMSEEVFQLDKTIPIAQRIKTARANVEARRADRINPSDRMKMDTATGAVDDWQELFGPADARTASRIKGAVMQSDWKWPDQDDARQIRGDQNTARGSSRLVDELNKFEETYGKGKIQNYVGLIDGKIGELSRRLKESKTEEEKNAYELLQRFNTVFNEEAFATSGKAVTQPETIRLKAAIGDIRSKNFVNDINNFAKFAAENLWTTIDDFKIKRKISPEQVKLANELVTKFKLPFTPFGQQQQSTPAPLTGTAPSLPPGVTPRTNATNSTSGVIFTP
jgi:hypothetical protein